MSAAEKLKALDKALSSMAISEADQLWLDLQPDFVSLRNALPRLVAVVEAAQSVTSADQGAWHGSRLLLSLAALDEALT